MDLHRQERPSTAADDRPATPQRVPETRPPLLGDLFIYVSIVVLISGAFAITALEFGNPITSAFVRFPALVAAGLLIVLSADASLRVWRSARAWWSVDRGRAAFRLVWAAVLVGVLAFSLWLIAFLVGQ
jgi:hypothetical protein